MYRRRVFYNQSGEVVRSYSMEGRFNSAYTAEMEKTELGLADCGCMEWLEPNADIEAAFANVDADGNPRMVEVSVDINGEEPQLVFTYTPIEDIEGDDPYEIIDILTGVI